ncbi:hypothetical protein ACN4EG_15665 [Alkalinema pantanalense CENA528]|uniref:hypothetical protein n=1 Tax=Alkalinema pantanalense TaxID=1620705 RepID=UPI003D6E733C
MSDISKVSMQFNAPITAITGNVEGDFILNLNSQSSVEAVSEIQELLGQLQQSNPINLEVAIQQEIQHNPTFKARLSNALKEAGLEAAKVLFAPLGIGIEAVRGWFEAQ